MSQNGQVVLAGEWLYDGLVPMPVYVVRFDFDYLFEWAKSDAFEAFGDETALEPDERPELDAEGFRFDLSFREHAGGRHRPDARGGLTIEEAKSAAETMLPAPVTWAGR